MIKKSLFVVMAAAVFLLFSCGDSGSPDDGVDFSPHNTNYSILVRNNTGERLVAFKGDLIPEKLIGGIPAHATGHGLPNDPSLFDRTEDFPMILITEAQYEANISNLQSLRHTPFTRVYVFFNRSGDNTHVYEIANGLGGNNSLVVINASNSINVELRLGGAAGETIGYAPAGILETTLRLQDGNYNVFPVFKRYNTFRDVVETVYPQGIGSGYAWFQSYSFGEGVTSATMNLKTLLQSINFTSGASWIVVDNQTTSAGIRFMEGTQVNATASGLTNIMTTRTFQIDMPRVGNGYATSRTINNWSFGPPGFEKALQVGESDATPAGAITVDENTMYTVTVTGDHNAGTIKAWISSQTVIPSSELAGTW